MTKTMTTTSATDRGAAVTPLTRAIWLAAAAGVAGSVVGALIVGVWLKELPRRVGPPVSAKPQFSGGSQDDLALLAARVNQLERRLLAASTEAHGEATPTPTDTISGESSASHTEPTASDAPGAPRNPARPDLDARAQQRAHQERYVQSKIDEWKRLNPPKTEAEVREEIDAKMLEVTHYLAKGDSTLALLTFSTLRSTFRLYDQRHGGKFDLQEFYSRFEDLQKRVWNE